jgi:hypothetical protein
MHSVPPWSCSKDVYKPVWHIPMLSVQWINSWWWTEELSETCRVSWQNKFVKLVHLVGFIIKKFIMMHGHMNVKLQLPISIVCLLSKDRMLLTILHTYLVLIFMYFRQPNLATDKALLTAGHYASVCILLHTPQTRKCLWWTLQKIPAFWGIIMSSLWYRIQLRRDEYRLHIQGSSFDIPEDGGTKFQRNSDSIYEYSQCHISKDAKTLLLPLW